VRKRQRSAPEALMKLSRDQNGLALETLAAMIVHSQIVVAQPAKPASRLPAGFDEVEISILDWIAAEGQCIGHSFVRM
jgi:ABC-type phosphate transport system auxiliary subunit